MKSVLRLRRILVSLFCLSLVSGSLFAAEGKPAAPEAKSIRPRLVDLGADRCIPCKMMAPVLAELAKDYTGQLEIVFIDVWKNAEQGRPYGVRVIPTQIFFDAAGKERFRHEGFMPKQAILEKWQELGIELKAPAAEKKG